MSVADIEIVTEAGLGQALRRLRIAAKLTQERAAEECGVGYRDVTNWEAGKGLRWAVPIENYRTHLRDLIRELGVKI